jgi:LEA14-like dessication related protein
MSRRGKIIAYGILVSLVVSAACAYAFRARIAGHFIPGIVQTGNIRIRVQNDTCYVSSRLIARNASFLRIGIDSIKYKVMLFNKVYLQDEEFLGIILPSHSDDTVDLAIKVPYKCLIKDIKAERKKGDSASYSINVSLQYSTFLGRSEMPLSKTARLKIPQPPDLEILDIKYKKFRRRSIHADVKVKITNYSPVDLLIKEMRYTMNVLDQGELQGKHGKEIHVSPNASTIIDFPIEISPKNIARTVFDIIIDKDSYDYTLTLNAVLESADPFKASFPIDLVKVGKMELRK